MDTNFFAYLQQLELLAFFSGYPLLYAIISVTAGKTSSKPTIAYGAYYILPLTYALAGTLYTGLQFRNLYPDYSFSHIRESIQQPFWTIWAISSLLFWLPTLRRKQVLSLLHSLPFFFLLARDLYFHAVNAPQDNNVVKNDMKIYTDSLILYFITITIVTLLYFLFKLKHLKNNR